MIGDPSTRIVVGAGILGRTIHELTEGVRSILVPARALAGDLPDMRQALAAGGVSLVFAHGANVNVPDFDRQFDNLLQTRIAPMSLLRTHLFGMPPLQTITLISSLVAHLEPTSDRSLPRLQRHYEDRFRTAFDNPHHILRVGTFLSPDSQLLLGVEALSRTLLMKRLRLRQDLPLAWAGPEDLIKALRDVECASQSVARDVVAVERASLNGLLDSELGDTGTLKVPDFVFRRIWSFFGIRPEFFSLHRSFARRD